jgi:hypothetical protein
MIVKLSDMASRRADGLAVADFGQGGDWRTH